MPLAQRDEDFVQCYDCRYKFPVEETISKTVNVGHSSGNFSGWGSTGFIFGSTGGNNYAGVDLCDKCAEVRRKQAEWVAIQVAALGLGIIIGAVFGFGTSSFWTGLIFFFLTCFGVLGIFHLIRK
jgi:hypothetical protein